MAYKCTADTNSYVKLRNLYLTGDESLISINLETDLGLNSDFEIKYHNCTFSLESTHLIILDFDNKTIVMIDINSLLEKKT